MNRKLATAVKPKTNGKPSIAAKLAGFDSLNELAEVTGESVQTLNNWYKNNSRRFSLIVKGAQTERLLSGKQSAKNKMKYAVAKRISNQQVYNNEFEVVSIHSNFNQALESSGRQEIIVEVSNEISIGDSINDGGKPWESQ